MDRTGFAASLKSNALPLLAALLCVLLFAVFFPSFFVSIDEHEYLKNASLFLQGKIDNANPLDYCGGKLFGQTYHSTYYPGKSFFLVPFLPLGLSGAMVSGLLIHLVNAIILFFILRRLKIDTRFVVLYLFFPAFVWNSRTLNTELLVLTAALLGTFFFLGKRRLDDFLAGFFFGLAALVRYDQALLFAGFAIARLLDDRKRFFPMLAGFGVIAVLILGINAAFYGGPLNAPSGGTAIHYLTGENSNAYSYFGGRLVLPAVVANLLFWIGIFLIAYPLMLLAPVLVLFSRERREGKNPPKTGAWFGLDALFQNDLKTLAFAVGISAIPLFYLFSQYTGQASYSFFSPLTITGRMRYLIPLAGLFLIPYFSGIESLLKKFRVDFRVFFVAAFLVLGSGAFLVSLEHQQQLVEPRYAVLNQILENTPDNALVIGSSDDCIYFSPLFSGHREYYRVDSNFLSLDQALSADRPIFFMELSYSNASSAEDRQAIIDRERKAIQDAIRDYNSQLTVAFSTREPHFLTLFSFQPRK